jgi:hypothetical protein
MVNASPAYNQLIKVFASFFKKKRFLPVRATTPIHAKSAQPMRSEAATGTDNSGS